jgi:DNA-binding NarL/FixJ family response regulator
MRVLVVDDHPLVRTAMAQVVAELEPGITVLEASDCAIALDMLRTERDCDLVLLDLHLPGVRGLAALDRLRSMFPSVPVVIVSMYQDRDTVTESIRRGAMGFIPKSSTRETILNALRLVMAGSVYLPVEAAVGAHLPAPLRGSLARQPKTAEDLGLTPRQGQVLGLVMKGRSNKEICRELSLAERTVKAHLTAVLNALEVTSRTQAVIAANALGLMAEDLLS